MDVNTTPNEAQVLADGVETEKKSGLPDLTTLEGAHEQIANLEVAVAHRTVIGQAIGILMERFDLDSDHAFALMARLSQDRNVKLYALATEIVERRQIDL